MRSKQRNRSSENLGRTHSDMLSKALLGQLTKVTRKQLEQDGIVMSKELTEDLPQVEVQYLLDNMIPTEELTKIGQIQQSFTSLTTLDEQFICQYCQKLKTHPDEVCCASREIQAYLSKCEDQKLLKRFSSYSLNNASIDSLKESLENVKMIGQAHKTMQERKSKISLGRIEEIKKEKASNQRNDQFKASNFTKHMGTFSRIQKKLENIKKYCPEMYTTDESVISMWAGSAGPSNI
ncbi:hypothetical protein Trydic_g21374 [Trypoxylus dichotomus]